MKVHQELDDILTFLVMSVDDSHKGWRLPLRNFNYADIMNSDFAPSLYNSRILADEGFFCDVHPNDLDGQWDVSIVTHVEGKEGSNRFFALQRFRRVPLKVARGYPVRSPYLGELTGAIVDTQEGTIRTERALTQLVAGNWQYLDCAYVPANYSHFRLHSKIDRQCEDFQTKLQLFLGMQFTRYYEWRVAVGMPGTISITFPTDPTGIKAIFKMRDVPEGLQRRAMLKNWVSEHTRQSRGSEEDAIWVRQHLRGHLQFTWQGFTCEVIPSQEAINKNIELAWLRERRRLGAPK
jgi:hypothetical protein